MSGIMSYYERNMDVFNLSKIRQIVFEIFQFKQSVAKYSIF